MKISAMDMESKKKAQYMVFQATKEGLLSYEGKCRICGNEEKTLFHHPDYSRPLLVIEVCYTCHQNIHKKTGKDSPIYGKKHSKETMKKLKRISPLRRKGKYKECSNCGNNIYVIPSLIGEYNYCSHKCYIEHRRNK